MAAIYRGWEICRFTIYFKRADPKPLSRATIWLNYKTRLLWGISNLNSLYKDGLGAHLDADTEITAWALIRILLTLKWSWEDTEVFKPSAAAEHFNQWNSWGSMGRGLQPLLSQAGTHHSSPHPHPPPPHLPGALLSDVYSFRGLISPGCTSLAWKQSNPHQNCLLTLQMHV